MSIGCHNNGEKTTMSHTKTTFWLSTYLKSFNHLVKDWLGWSHQSEVTLAFYRIYYVDDQTILVNLNGLETGISHSMFVRISTIGHGSDFVRRYGEPSQMPGVGSKIAHRIEYRSLKPVIWPKVAGTNETNAFKVSHCNIIAAMYSQKARKLVVEFVHLDVI
jgi:hypothetical protein